MTRCPKCQQLMPTDDPLEATWVALGEAVCGHECHQKAYELYAPKTQDTLDLEPDFYLQP